MWKYPDKSLVKFFRQVQVFDSRIEAQGISPKASEPIMSLLFKYCMLCCMIRLMIEILHYLRGPKLWEL